MGKAIRNRLFDFPAPRELPATDNLAPFVVLGDEAFPLLPNLLKPYPRNQSLIDHSKAVFNYRLSRARRIVENAFGILTQRFRIFSTAIFLHVETIEDVITSACILHNLMADERINSARNEHMIEFASGGLEPLEPDSIQSALPEPQAIRDSFKDYFNSVGAVSWQNDMFRL